MLNFKSNITYYLSSTPTDMRKSREGLAGVVREKMQRDPYTYGDAFIFYSKDLKKAQLFYSKEPRNQGNIPKFSHLKV